MLVSGEPQTFVYMIAKQRHRWQLLNEIAGRTASKVVGWVVPQLMEAWDNENTDINRTVNRIIYGVFHHPAQRDMGEDGASDGRHLMFRSVEEWWNEKGDREKDDYRRKLSRDGVFQGENHKEGVHDTGHGCGKPIGMHKQFPSGGTMEDRIVDAAAGAIMGGFTSGVSNIVASQTGIQLPTFDQQSSHSSGGGGGGGVLGGLLGAAAGNLFGGGSKEEQTTTYHSSGRTDDGGYNQTVSEYGRQGDRYGQAQYSETQYPGGGERTEYRRYEQDQSSNRHGGQQRQGYGYEERTDTRPSYGGGYEERTERTWEDSQGGSRRQEEVSNWSGGRREESHSERRDDYSAGGSGGGRRHHHREEGYGEQREEERRDDGGSGGWGGGLGSLGGNILENIARQAEETFEEARDENRGERRGGGGWGF